MFERSVGMAAKPRLRCRRLHAEVSFTKMIALQWQNMEDRVDT